MCSLVPGIWLQNISESHSILVPISEPAFRIFWQGHEVQRTPVDGGRQGRSHSAHKEEYVIKHRALVTVR
jgi:hypothetical protein